MPITVFLTPFEIEKYSIINDKEFNEIFQEIRGLFGERYLLKEEWIAHRRWIFGKKRVSPVYTLYVMMGYYDAQVINFKQPHNWSINTAVDKSYIYAYFYGLLNGFKEANNQVLKTLNP